MTTNNSCNYSPTIFTVQVGGSSGKLTSIANGSTGQVLTAISASNPIWQVPASSTQVGAATNFFPSIIASADNLSLTTTPTSYAEVINAKSTSAATSPVFFERFISGALGRTDIPAGVWEFNSYLATTALSGTNNADVVMRKRVVQTAMTGTFTGAGATRTFTVSGGTPFVAGDANASILLSGLIETPTQTAWITAFTSSSVVTVTLTDPAFVNVAGVTLNAIYYFLFNDSTPDFILNAVTLYEIDSVQPTFTALNITDALVVEYFATTTGGAARTFSLYYGGTLNFSYFLTPLITVAKLTANSGGMLSPDVNNNFNIFGSSGSITSGSGNTITVKAPAYTDQGSSTTVTPNSGSVATASITLTAPATASLSNGDVIEFFANDGPVVIQLVNSQTAKVGTLTTSVNGTITSTASGDYIKLRYRSASNTFLCAGIVGTWLIA